MKAHNVFEYPEGFAIVMPHFARGGLAGLMLDPIELKDAVRQIPKAHISTTLIMSIVIPNPPTF